MKSEKTFNVKHTIPANDWFVVKELSDPKGKGIALPVIAFVVFDGGPDADDWIGAIYREQDGSLEYSTEFDGKRDGFRHRLELIPDKPYPRGMVVDLTPEPRGL
jgi:hypothetical protein